MTQQDTRFNASREIHVPHGSTSGQQQEPIQCQPRFARSF